MAIGETRRMAGRLYTHIELGDILPGDIVAWQGRHIHYNKVKSASKKAVTIFNHKGLKPVTKRVFMNQVRECWRWHKKVEGRADSEWEKKKRGP